MDGQTDEVSVRVAVGGSQPRPGPRRDVTHRRVHSWCTETHAVKHTEQNSANSRKREGVKQGPQTHTHTQPEWLTNRNSIRLLWKAGRRASSWARWSQIQREGGEEGERGSDRHTDRRDSDTAHRKGTHTETHTGKPAQAPAPGRCSMPEASGWTHGRGSGLEVTEQMRIRMRKTRKCDLWDTQPQLRHGMRTKSRRTMRQ